MPGEVTFGIVTALAIELAAVRTAMDGVGDCRVAGDPHYYWAGTIASTDQGAPHQVVVSLQTRDGTRDAAASVVDLIRSFPSLRSVLMCGIAAGAPTGGPRRGDIVSATDGVIDYGHVRAAAGARALRRPLGDVSAEVLRADHRLAEGEIHGRRPWISTLAALERENAAFRRPPPPGTPAVHRGAIGSADVLLRDAALRDDLARRHRVIAFDMEASGVATAARLHGREWFMVRGVSDLADEHKDDRWHGYAAATAASYLRALLGMIAPEAGTAVPGRRGGPGRMAAVSRIVEALLASRRVRDEHDRQRLLDELPTHIRSGIPYSPTSRTHVISIVRTCQYFPDGQDALLEALSLLLGTETPEFSTLADVIRHNWSDD
jgi:nucleoside phosphorylase